jgi:hypothetical protein
MTAEEAVPDAIERRRRLASIRAWAGAIFCVFPVRLDLPFTCHRPTSLTDVTAVARRMVELAMRSKSVAGGDHDRPRLVIGVQGRERGVLVTLGPVSGPKTFGKVYCAADRPR